MSTKYIGKKDSLTLPFDVAGTIVNVTVSPDGLREYFGVSSGDPLIWMSGSYWEELLINVSVFLSDYDSKSTIKNMTISSSRLASIMKSPTS